MKSSCFGVITIALVLTAISASAQIPAAQVIRLTPCTLNDGYSMTDVAGVARTFPFGDNAPNAIFFREALYVGPAFTENYDFVIAAFYPSYAALAQSRGALRNAPTSAQGIIPQDMMSCGTPFLRNSYIANQGDELPDDQTLLVSRRCDLNGNSVADAVDIASTVASNFSSEGVNPQAAVGVRGFGGSQVPSNDRVTLRFVGSTVSDATKMMDLVLNGFNYAQGLDTEAPLACYRPNLWLSHKIFVRN